MWYQFLMQCYAFCMLCYGKIRLKDLMIWYCLLCCAIVCYDVWTKWPLNTEEFQTFQRRMTRRQILTLILTFIFFYFDKTCFTVKIMLHAIVCYGILCQMKTIILYAILWYFNTMPSYSNVMLSDYNAMLSDSNAIISYFNAMLWIIL